MDEKQKKVIEIIVRETDIPAVAIHHFTRLDALNIDSLEFVNLLHCVRNEVGPISENKVTHIETVADLVNAVEC